MKLGDRFAAQSEDLRAHYAAAKAAQWRLDDLEWDTYPLVLSTTLPAGEACTVRANLIAGLYAWSDALLRRCSHLTSAFGHADAQLLLAVHVHTYARHADVWRAYLERLGAEGRLPRGVTAMIAHVSADATPSRTLRRIHELCEPGLRVVYAALAEHWCCPLGRHLCARLGADVQRQHGDIGAILALLEAGEPAPEVEVDRLLGFGELLEPELGPARTSDLRNALN